MSVPMFRFAVSDGIRGFAAATIADRVGLNFGGAYTLNVNLTMSAEEARSVANALYEAADASEKVLPVAAAAVAS